MQRRGPIPSSTPLREESLFFMYSVFHFLLILYIPSEVQVGTRVVAALSSIGSAWSPAHCESLGFSAPVVNRVPHVFFFRFRPPSRRHIRPAMSFLHLKAISGEPLVPWDGFFFMKTWRRPGGLASHKKQTSLKLILPSTQVRRRGGASVLHPFGKRIRSYTHSHYYPPL